MKTKFSLLLIILVIVSAFVIHARTTPVHPIRKYEALLTQTGTANPTAIVLENTLGTSVVWVREQAGLYTTTGAFPANRTTLDIGSVSPGDDGQAALGDFFQLDAGTRLAITVNTLTGELPLQSTDGGLNKTRVEIVVYPE